jgi:large subunit ribosomal protein L22
MEARCVSKYLRVTPRKMRLVADLVRGKNVNDAIGLLKFTPRSGAGPTLKAIQSAVANIVNRDDAHDVNPDQLVVKTIFVDEGPTLKRFLPRAMGRATPIRKRLSHLTVLVGVPEAPQEEPTEAPVETVEAAAPAVEETKPAKQKTAAKTTTSRKKKTE